MARFDQFTSGKPFTAEQALRRVMFCKAGSLHTASLTREYLRELQSQLYKWVGEVELELLQLRDREAKECFLCDACQVRGYCRKLLTATCTSFSDRSQRERLWEGVK